MAWRYTLTGLVGLVGSLVLTSSYFGLTERASVSCGALPFTLCSPVMSRHQMELGGLPAPLLGVAWFGLLVALGAAIRLDCNPGRWWWLGLQVAGTASVVGVHWMMLVALFRIGVVETSFVAVWVAAIAAFWFTTVHNLSRRRWDCATVTGRVVTAVVTRHGAVLTVWIVGVGALVAIRLWAGWLARLM